MKTDAAPVIELEEIHKVYRAGDVEVPAVCGVNLKIETGEFVVIMGASGSGKSTLMNILGCLDRPTRGRYLLDGIDVSGIDAETLAEVRNRKLGFIFQNFNLLSRTSALENVELPMLYSMEHLSFHEQQARAQHALEIVGLSERAHHHPSQLSGGQQQRVAIARSLVNQPKLLLADEPTGNLDSHTSVEIMGVFQKLNEEGITIVMVTHEPDIAMYSKRNIVMRDGRVLSDARVAQRLRAEDELKRLVESHPTSVLPA